jgi:phage-related protein (TIGR01555 family)
VESYAVEHNREIHASRLLIFHGGRCIKKGSWPQSILQRIYPVLQQFHLAWQSTAHLMSDGAQGVFKLKGLHNAIASNKTGDILKRLEMVDMGRSVARSVLLDAEDEDFRRDTYSFSGVPQILEKMMLRLAAAAKIPVSLLMGQSPAGLHATGDSDIRFFYDQVRAEQEGIKPKMMHLIELLMRSKDGPTKGELFPFQITFPSLWQMTEKEKAELQKLHSETDCRYIQEGVLLPEEVAAMRFSGLVSLKDREVLKRAERSSYGE